MERAPDSTDTFDLASERLGYGPGAWCPECDRVFTLDEAKELDWNCDCGGKILED